MFTLDDHFGLILEMFTLSVQFKLEVGLRALPVTASSSVFQIVSRIVYKAVNNLFVMVKATRTARANQEMIMRY